MIGVEKLTMLGVARLVIMGEGTLKPTIIITMENGYEGDVRKTFSNNEELLDIIKEFAYKHNPALQREDKIHKLLKNEKR